MERSYRENLVGVFGDPVDENPTVVIEQAAFDACKLPFRYLTILVKPGDLSAAMAGMRAMNFSGVNITMPFKTEVLRYLDEVAEDAAVMGSVNVVCRKEDGRLRGENTDGKGFMRTLLDAGVTVSGKKAVLLGAGGAARAIAVELANAGAASIEIINRSPQRGEALTELLNEKTGTPAVYTPWVGTCPIPAGTDILVNTTSIGFEDAGQKPNIDYDTLTPDTIVCDVIPNREHTLFMEEAARRGCRTFSGFSMLVNQGALAFELWTGHPAPVDVMTEALRKAYHL